MQLYYHVHQTPIIHFPYLNPSFFKPRPTLIPTLPPARIHPPTTTSPRGRRTLKIIIIHLTTSADATPSTPTGHNRFLVPIPIDIPLIAPGHNRFLIPIPIDIPPIAPWRRRLIIIRIRKRSRPISVLPSEPPQRQAMTRPVDRDLG